MAESFRAAFATRPAAEWCELLADAAVSPVRSVTEAWQTRGGSPADAGAIGAMRAASSTYSAHPGSHSRELLQELGYADGDADALVVDGAVAQA